MERGRRGNGDSVAAIVLFRCKVEREVECYETSSVTKSRVLFSSSLVESLPALVADGIISIIIIIGLEIVDIDFRDILHRATSFYALKNESEFRCYEFS